MGQALWFLSRAAGLVALLLLTATVVVGTRHAARSSGARWPRFAVAAVHRNLSLLALVFVAVHAASAIVDPYAGLRWVDAVVPFVAGYHPLWLGLGTVALDLMLALVVTSLLRHRLGPRTWRALHLTAYLLWPLAVVHGLGIGGDDSALLWVRALNAACAVAVLVAVVRRLRAPNPDRAARRALADGHR